MTSQPTSILLLGAGELGLAVLSSISTLPNTHITLAVRSTGKYTHLTSSNVSLLQFDLTSPSATITQTFSNYDTVISCTGFTSASGSMVKLASEILAAGKMRKERGEAELWFFPWQWGVDYDVTGDGGGLMPLFGEQKGVRELLRQKAEQNGVRWTVVSTGIFMSFLFEPFWGIVEHEMGKRVKVRCLGDWKHGVSVTDVSDIGRVVKRILMGDVEGRDRVVYVAGDSVRYEELAIILERVNGHGVVREAWSTEYLREELEKDPEDGIKKYRLVFSGDGVFWEKEKTANHHLGMKMTDVETYANKLFNIRD